MLFLWYLQKWQQMDFSKDIIIMSSFWIKYTGACIFAHMPYNIMISSMRE